MILKSVGVIAAVLALAVAFGGKDAGAAPAASNFIVNGDFDVDVSGWEVPSPDVIVTHEASVDRYGDAFSGSVRISNAPGGPAGVAIRQCLRVAPGIPVTITGWVNMPVASQPPGASSSAMILFFPNETCANGPSGFDNVLVAPAAGWQQLLFSPIIPDGVYSVSLSLGVSKSLGEPALAYAFFDAVTATATGDADGDGCLDGAELGQDPALGGGRNPLDGADFFDVPTPALLPGNTSGVRDGQINLADVLAIITYAGTSQSGSPNPAGAGYDTDHNANGVADGAEYDRTPSQDPAEPWRSGPPDGAVTLADVIVALQQTGHNCGA